MWFYVQYTIINDTKLVSKGVINMIRINGMIQAEKEYAYDEFQDKINFISIEAQNSYYNEIITVSFLKCICRFNHYSIRDLLINNRKKTDKYPQYST